VPRVDPIRVTIALPEDFPAILDVQRQSFLVHADKGLDTSIWTEETLEEITRDATEKTILVARDPAGAVLGSVRFQTIEGVVFVRKVNVRPDMKRHGVGRLLMLALEEHIPADAHKISLCTLLMTHENIPFFLRMGYRPETVLPDHYHHVDLLCFGKYPAKKNPA